MEIKLEDLKIGEWYGFYTKSQGVIQGVVVAKQHIELQNGFSDGINVKVTNVPSPITIVLDEIVKYYHFEMESGTYTDACIYNKELSAYGIKLGDSVTNILNQYINHWGEYDEKTKKNLTGEIMNAMTNCNLVDLISALVDYKSGSDENHRKYMNWNCQEKCSHINSLNFL